MDAMWEWLRQNLTEWSLAKIYISCATAGGALLVIQLLLGLFGFGASDVDVEDVDVSEPSVGDSGESLNLLSLRAIASFLALFGLVGWYGTSAGWSQPKAAMIALLAGVGTMLLVAWMMRTLLRLSESGTLDPSEAVGKVATVYLRIPGNRSGKGKITVSIRGRSVELSAVTSGSELPTGSECQVVAMTAGDTFEVERVQRSGER